VQSSSSALSRTDVLEKKLDYLINKMIAVDAKLDMIIEENRKMKEKMVNPRLSDKCSPPADTVEELRALTASPNIVSMNRTWIF